MIVGSPNAAGNVRDSGTASVLFGFGVDAVQGKVAALPMEREPLLAWLAGRPTV